MTRILLPISSKVRGAVARALHSERSGFEPLSETYGCVLGQDTSLSQCLSPSR